MAPSNTRRQQEEADRQNTAGQSDPAPPTSDSAMLAQMMEMMQNMSTRLEALEARSPSPAPALPTPPAAPQIAPHQSEQSQQKKKRNQKTRQQYKRRILQQANMEKVPENATASINSTVNTSLLSTTLHQAAKKIDRERTSHGSSGTQFHGYNSFRLRFLAIYHYIMLASPPAYTRYAEEMEATGQG